MESTPGEVSNYILHDAECELYQKLLAEDFLPGTRLIGNISVTKYGTKMKKNTFSDLHYHTNQLVYMRKGNSQF